MNENKPQTEVVTTGERFYVLMFSDRYLVKSVRFCAYAAVVEYENKRGKDQPFKQANIAIAIYVTAHARLKLYNTMKQVGPRRITYVGEFC